MPFDVQPVAGPGPGAIVTGLDLESLADPQVRRDLHDLWIREGLLVCRGLDGGEAQVRLSEAFGTLTRHPVREAWVDGHPELIDVRYNPDKGSLYNVDGTVVGAWLPWHSDLMYVDKINHGGVLRALEISEVGGRTGFIDQIAAHDRLPDDLKTQIEGLSIAYKLNFDPATNKFLRKYNVHVTRSTPERDAIMLRAQGDDFPVVVHPMVYAQAETGRKVLNVCPYNALGIHGRLDPAGDALLQAVFDHCLDERFAYFHQWRLGDMVAWDNWRMLHCVEGIPPSASRRMQRTTIAGDYRLGRLADDGRAAAADEPEYA